MALEFVSAPLLAVEAKTELITRRSVSQQREVLHRQLGFGPVWNLARPERRGSTEKQMMKGTPGFCVELSLSRVFN